MGSRPALVIASVTEGPLERRSRSKVWERPLKLRLQLQSCNRRHLRSSTLRASRRGLSKLVRKRIASHRIRSPLMGRSARCRQTLLQLFVGSQRSDLEQRALVVPSQLSGLSGFNP